jgi:hypothetical protein
MCFKKGAILRTESNDRSGGKGANKRGLVPTAAGAATSSSGAGSAGGGGASSSSAAAAAAVALADRRSGRAHGVTTVQPGMDDDFSAATASSGGYGALKKASTVALSGQAQGDDAAAAAPKKRMGFLQRMKSSAPRAADTASIGTGAGTNTTTTTTTSSPPGHGMVRANSSVPLSSNGARSPSAPLARKGLSTADGDRSRSPVPGTHLSTPNGPVPLATARPCTICTFALLLLARLETCDFLSFIFLNFD